MQAQHNHNGPLKGYRVLDFGWVLAGAIPGMILADLGAQVIKVETHRRLDYMRQGRPIIGDKPDPEQNPMFHNVNRGKLSVTLDTSRPEAVDLALRLAAHCDVVIQNFSPGVMDKLGMGYEEMRRHKPDMVMVSISSTGQSGPLRDLRAYAPSVGALSGVDSTLGYEGGSPLGLKHAYADLCGALHAVFAIMASLYERRRTGRGRHIDISMLRATVASMGVGLMEYMMTGRVLKPRGNYSPSLAPHGNYRCRGEDQVGLHRCGNGGRVEGAGDCNGRARLGKRWHVCESLSAAEKPRPTRRAHYALDSHKVPSGGNGGAPVPRSCRHDPDGC